MKRLVLLLAAMLVISTMAFASGNGVKRNSAVLDSGLGNILSGYYWDPLAVRFCQEAGEGAVLDLRVGGKCGLISGDPVDTSN